jgi:hypothetical protein
MVATAAATPADDEARRALALRATLGAARAGATARWALAVTGLLDVACLVVALMDLAYLQTVDGNPTLARAREMNDRAGLLANVGWIAFGLSTMYLTRWFQSSWRAALATGGHPGVARRGLPFMRPYERLRALDQALDPDRVVEPPPQPQTAEHAGDYRTPAVAPRPRGQVGPAPLLAWWVLWLGCTGILVFRWLSKVSWTDAKELDALASALGVGAQALAFVFVTRMVARLQERTRRAFP